MSKIKIFQFPIRIRKSNGGITRYAIRNWKNLDHNRFLCDFGTVSRQIHIQNEIEASGAGLKYISCYAEENYERFAEEMRSILQQGGYDVVHLHTRFWKSFLVEEIARDCGIPKVIVHAHNTEVNLEEQEARSMAEKVHWQKRKEFNTSLATDFWACSTLAADWLFGEQIPRDRIVIMNNAVEVEKFLFSQAIREKYRREFGLEGCFVIGCIGHLAYQKNQEFLISLFAEVCKKIANARLLLIGSGPLEDEMNQQAEALGLSEKIVFACLDDDTKFGLLQAMDLYCQPSRFEGLPVSMIEAQTAGLMCLASDTITQEVAITENVKRLPLDTELWLERIVELSAGYERKDMYEVITAAGYNMKDQIKQMEELYTS